MLIDCVVKELFPVANGLPPLAAAYQSIVSPPEGIAEMVTVPGPHLAALVPVGAAGVLLIVAVTAVLEGDMPPQLIFLACAK